MEGGGGYSPPTDRLPFLAFTDIYNDPARVASHLFDISQIEPDLTRPPPPRISCGSPRTMKRTWRAPLDFPFGLSIGPWPSRPAHQYNVAAGDEWLQEEVPSS